MAINHDKLREFIHPFTAAVILMYLQLHNFPLFKYHPDSDLLSLPFLINAAVMGIIFSFSGCPGCYLGLLFSFSIYEKKHLRHILVALTIFSLFRALTVFIYALAGEWGGRMMISHISGRTVFFIEGIIMVAFAALIAIPWIFPACKRYGFTPQKASFFLYALWGMILGLPCAVESTGFLSYLWLYPGGILLKILSFVLFSLFSLTSLLLVLIGLFTGITVIQHIFQTIKIYFRNTAVFYLMFTGVIFIVYALI